MSRVFIGIGANLGNPLAQCQMALELIGGIEKTTLTACSSFYRSEPLLPDQLSPAGIPQYVNAVCEVKTSLSDHLLLEKLKEIEKKMGRKNRGKWASREIDLDLLLAEDHVVEIKGMILPHPEMHRRAFVLKPLVEIAPKTLHPVLRKTVAELAKNLEDGLDVKKMEGR